MSQSPQKPKNNPNIPQQPLTAAQQKRQNVLLAREERDRRERAAQQQGRLLTIVVVIVVVAVIAGLIAFAVLSGQNNNNTNSNVAANNVTPLPASNPTNAATNVANPTGGVPPVNGNEVTTASGLRYIDTQVGTGATPTKGQTITANYTGYLESGKVFDSSVGAGRQPFSFTLGAGQVIKGWDEGFATMKVGGKRRLIIPPSLGYGAQGAGGVIPPNATLIFDVELLDTK